MKRPLPSIPSIIPAAVIKEAKEKGLIYVGQGDDKTAMFSQSVAGYRWYVSLAALLEDPKMIGLYSDYYFFLSPKTALKFFDVPKDRYFKNAPHFEWGEVAVFKICADGKQFDIWKDGTYDANLYDLVTPEELKRWTESGDWVEITASQAKARLSSFKKPAPDIEATYKPYGTSAITKLTKENAALKARVAKLEAVIRAANSAL